VSAVLMLLPAALGAICLAIPLGVRRGRPIIAAASVLGIVCGLFVFITRESADAWRATLVVPSTAAIVGIAVACSFALVWAVHRDDGWFQAATVGVASSGLLLAAASQWAVPMLMFWGVSAVALGALTMRDQRRGSIWAALFLSDALWIASVLIEALDREEWRFEGSFSGASKWFVVGAVILRAGVFVRVGVWGALSRAGAAAVPLIIAGAFVIAARAQLPVHAVISVALLTLAVATAVWTALRHPGDISSSGAWVSALMVSAVFVAPGVVARAGVTAVLAGSVVALWRWSTSGARVWRAAILGLVPLTSGFGVIVAAALAAFERAAAAQEIVEAAPLTAIGSLLPLTVGLGIVMAVRVGRLGEPAIHPGWETLTTWGLFAASIAVGMLPIAVVGIPMPLGQAAGRSLALHVTALIAAAAVGSISYLRHRDVLTEHATGTAMSRALIPRRSAAALLTGAALIFLVGSVATITWLTVRGLLVGFL
jgi:hypothetical protein